MKGLTNKINDLINNKDSIELTIKEIELLFALKEQITKIDMLESVNASASEIECARNALKKLFEDAGLYEVCKNILFLNLIYDL